MRKQLKLSFYNEEISMQLVFIRHGQSEWNAKNLFTGWRDVKLSLQGIEEAQAAHHDDDDTVI